MTEEQKVMATLDEYANAYCSKDIDRLMSIFVDGNEISLIGTGADEICSGRSAVEAIFRRNFNDASANWFEWGWKNISVFEEAAIVAIALNIHLEIDGSHLVVPIRWTVSMVSIDGEWKWVHRHASTPANSQSEGSAYPTAD